MRLSRQAALAVALTLGLAAVILGYFYLRGQKPPPKKPERAQLPVPIQDIPADSDLALDMFEPVTFEPDEIPRDAVRDANELVGHIALEPLPEGEPVIRAKIARRSAALALAYAIPEGLRAVTIAVDTVAGVAHFIKPGDYVDYLTIFNGSEGEALCQTVLQNVQVLAIDRQTKRESGDNGNGDGNGPTPRGPEGGTHVTLAVSPHQAQLVALSDTRGEVRLSLRRTGDHEVVSLKSAQSWTLIGTFPEKEAAPQAGPGQQPTQPPTWADMWGGAPVQPPQPPTAEEEAGIRRPTEPAARGGIEVIRGSSREYVNPTD